MLLAATRRWCDALVALLLFAMMLVTFLDVLGRYVMARPVPGSTEIIQYLLVLVVFLALPIVTWRDEHISISLVEGAFGQVVNRLRRAAVRALSGAVMLAVGWHMWGHAGMLARNRDVIGYLELPVAPGAYAVGVLTLITSLTFLVAAALEFLGHLASHDARSAASGLE
jgi:TRAP-type C4-dicarboxylate transport system permease small subunit